MELNFILNFIDAVFLQMDFFGMREGPLGTDDPMIKGVINVLGLLLDFCSSEEPSSKTLAKC